MGARHPTVEQDSPRSRRARGGGCGKCAEHQGEHDDCGPDQCAKRGCLKPKRRGEVAFIPFQREPCRRKLKVLAVGERDRDDDQEREAEERERNCGSPAHHLVEPRPNRSRSFSSTMHGQLPASVVDAGRAFGKTFKHHHQRPQALPQPVNGHIGAEHRA